MSSGSQKRGPPSNGPVSPYKKIKNAKNEYVAYRQMSQLTANKAYKIYRIDHTKHEKFGEGELAYITEPNNRKSRVQLPGKYLKTLSLPEDIDRFKSDIKAERFQFLVFRAQLDDSSYEIDIIEWGTNDVLQHFEEWTDIPELEDSVQEQSPAEHDEDDPKETEKDRADKE